MKTSAADTGFPLAKIAAMFVIVTAACGWAIIFKIRSIGLDGPLNTSSNVFERLFARNEPLGLALPALLSLFVFERANGSDAAIPSRGTFANNDVFTTKRMTRFVWLIAVLVFAACAIGADAGMHRMALSMDEYNADFEAQLMREGMFAGAVPVPWQSFVLAIRPEFVTWQPADGTWFSSYLPGYAGIRAAVGSLSGAAWLTNPLLAALSVPLLANVVRKRWPDQNWKAAFAVIAFATSSQLLVTSMTSYSMPAHLFLNLLFLNLYLRQDAIGTVGAPLTGALALGLHNPFPHALFVLPLLVRAARERKATVTALWAFIYLLASAVWLRFLVNAHPLGATGGLLDIFRWPTLSQGPLQFMNLGLLISWQSPVTALLLIAALTGVRRLRGLEMDLAIGVLLSFGFYLLFPSTQGHGWGFRYVFGVLGNMCVLATAATPWFDAALGARSFRRFAYISLLLTVTVQIPLRLHQAFSFTRPFSRAMRLLEDSDADLVLVDTDSLWYGRDLIRNDPLFRTRPILARSSMFSVAQQEMLAARYGLRITHSRVQDLIDAGLERVVTSPPDSAGASRR